MCKLYKLQTSWRRLISILGCFAVVSLFGCVGTKPAASSAPQQTTQSSNRSAPSTPEVPAPSVGQPKPEQNSIAAVERPTPTANATTTVKTPDTRTPKSEPPTAKTPVKPPAPVASATPAPKQPDAAIVPEKAPPTPTLDLKSLEQRLRDTRAIGTFTKLSLKNQVDDLLDDFRDYYRGKLKTPLSELRQRYDLLLMKVLSLLQDSDASLAAAISSSREAIWDILKDPKKFSQI